MKPDILQLGPQADRITEQVARDFTIHRYWEAADKRALLNGMADRLEYIVTSHQYGPDAALIRALPRLRLIASMGAGLDGIDLVAARAAGVAVTNTPDVLNDCVAELTLGLMIALARGLVAGDRFVRDGRWGNGEKFPLQSELAGKTVGILGLGRIGKEIARRCQVFRMQVVYHGRNRQAEVPFRYHADLTRMAEECDWLVAVAPGGDETRHLVNAAVLDALGPRGCLVNVGRGSSIDEAALVEALLKGRLGGAALDVFATEPRPHDALLHMPNVVLSPHAGSATQRTRDAMADLVVENLRAQLAGRPLLSRAG